MTVTSDPAKRPRPPASCARRGVLLDRVQAQLAALRQRELGRDIGRCARCGKPVRTQQDFMRNDGAVVHLRCRITDPATRPAPP